MGHRLSLYLSLLLSLIRYDLSAIMITLMNKSLNITAYNSRGLSLSIPYIRDILVSCDILCISEHWLHSNRTSKLSELGTNIEFCVRSSCYANSDNYGVKRGQGGVAFVWKKSLGGISEFKDLTNDRICGVCVQTSSGAILNILSCYLPSKGSPESFDSALDDPAEIISSREAGSLSIVCGDLNADLGNIDGGNTLYPVK